MLLNHQVQTILYAIYRLRLWVFHRYFLSKPRGSPAGSLLTDSAGAAESKSCSVAGADVEMEELEEILPRSYGEKARNYATVDRTEEVCMIDDGAS